MAFWHNGTLLTFPDPGQFADIYVRNPSKSDKQSEIKTTESIEDEIETWELIILYDSAEWRETHLQFLDLIKLQKYDFRVNFNFYESTSEPFSIDEILLEKRYKKAEVILERISFRVHLWYFATIDKIIQKRTFLCSNKSLKLLKAIPKGCKWTWLYSVRYSVEKSRKSSKIKQHRMLQKRSISDFDTWP